MAKVPLPSKSQPVDVSYIYKIAEVINQLADQVSLTSGNNTILDTASAGKQNTKTSNLSILGGRIIVANNSTVTATSTKPFTYMFDTSFKYSPIVTASVINSAGTSAGENVSVILTDISKSSVTGLVRFNSSGDVSIIVNLIILGIPN